MELALSLEKLTNEKLLNLHNVRLSSFPTSIMFYIAVMPFDLQHVNKLAQGFISLVYEIVGQNLVKHCRCVKQVAERNHDSQLTDFIEGEFLAEQVTIRTLLSMPSGFSVFIYISHPWSWSRFCFLNRLKPSRKYRNTWLSWEELAKDMVWILNFSVSSSFLQKHIIYHNHTLFINLGVWHFDQMLLHEGAVAWKPDQRNRCLLPIPAIVF